MTTSNVICKPPSAKNTPDYKVAELNKLGKVAHVAWFLTESKRDIAAAQAGTKAPCVLLEYPLGEAGNYRVASQTPALEVAAKPR